ncbi:phosphoserine phosphatase SerB [Helicobacter sp. 13S00482-2]|uniref:phosphoserine phosphatase SerB n=1 Tax=Helicobacter sp. 13S00482-2 TaxID=1476200 RepID=UPI000BA53146|nr:phosphoserine phosphatase SerB [Helicobacter sp. 13S00482-2]PAF54431.1 phosphoserine phosphatase SerB [Helicobacter sp. 13S00482-2]
MKLAVFDFDSTLMDGETIEFLAKDKNVIEQITQITKKAMEGEMDFYESLKMRVKLLEGMDQKRAIEICHHLPLNPGAKECITELKNHGYKVVCFSGGFKFATEYFRDILGLDGEFSNTLHCKNGKLTGEVGGEMMFDFSKGAMLLTLQRILGVSIKDTLVAGDGANDASMFAYADKKIAFCAKKILRQQANIIINKKDLREILCYL